MQIRIEKRMQILNFGDSVLARQEMRDELSTPFNPKPCEIIKKIRSMITARREDSQIIRNSSFVKTVKNSPCIPPTESQTFDKIKLEKGMDGSAHNSKLLPHVLPVNTNFPPLKVSCWRKQ
ncbi:hypothetical protein CHS0354_030009 [Potamilus streckersoni]|uniref:Uncharacterized protein n=1 Tax=Potamilus streckersoni TaxID=2493646 RepID=A0AAE0SM78_9BIVA|nr:hypothetical protein CHS0354_030009 [Potamilus streckersoni]